MKKAFLLLITMSILTGSIWLKAGADSDQPIKTLVFSEYFTELVPGVQLPARWSASDEVLHDLYCEASEQPGYIACQVPNEYAGQQLYIEFTKNKVMHIYIVTVPKQ
jgi:hypothetical protein